MAITGASRNPAGPSRNNAHDSCLEEGRRLAYREAVMTAMVKLGSSESLLEQYWRQFKRSWGSLWVLETLPGLLELLWGVQVGCLGGLGVIWDPQAHPS